ncbi:Espin [Geodia barretti]|uniref:Espin n=1 Tax=Geodia barretti TaxID=519541 RepID=A0AA35WC49_GEOBA|nr:Espin [Geodia barretti]
MSESDLKEGQPGPPPDSPVEQLLTHEAAANNDIARLSDLVQEGSPLVGPDTRETPLHAAAKKGAMDALRWLLDNGTVSPLEKAGNGNTAAHYAAVYGHLEALKLLIEHDPELSTQVVSQVDESGLSLISLATLQGDEEMTGWLVDNFPEVGDIPNLNGDLAVHFAAAQGHLGILKLLVRQYGKEILEKQDKNSTKPVYFASQEGRLAVLDYLINELGIDPVAREKSGISSVHAAVQAGRYKAVKWLVSKLGAKYILDKTIDGATPLHMAAAQGHTDILRYLLENVENKNDVNALDHIHATPAHDAAEYGQMESMLLLLKNGADITIKDTENKTPYDLAMEQSHPEVAAMIADLRDNGPMVLAKYEKKKRSSSQESLQRTNERGVEDDPKQLVMSEEDEIEHTLGPNGDLYAKPRKRRHRHRSRQRSGEDLHNDPSYAPVKPKNTVYDAMPPLEDPTYASPNHETTSNYSRPSRVRHYRDSDSEITSISSRYRGSYEHRNNPPTHTHTHNPNMVGTIFQGFYPPYGPGGVGGGGGGGGYNYLPLPHHLRRGPHSSASSVRSSKTGVSRRQGYPHPMVQYPYGHYPTPYPSYGYPYPHYGQSQASAPGQMMYYYYPPPKGRRHKLRRKKLRSRQPSRDPSPPGGIPKKHTDADMGYGPAVVQNRDEGSVVGGAKSKRGKASSNQGFHPQAPPITVTDTNTAQQGDAVVNFDGNFIMMKKSDTTDGIQELGGTTLITAKSPKHYDGRWDEFIMTDSEPEHEVDENHCVAFAAESVAILAIGCVSGLRGLRKLRKGAEGSQPDRAYLSSAWDEPPMPTKNRGSRTHSRQDSLTGLADPSLKDVTPEDFAAERGDGRAGGMGRLKHGEEEQKEGAAHIANTPKNKKAGKKEEIELKYRSASAEALDKQPQSELLAGEMERQRNASVSRNFGQKMLFNALGARESSMLDIATTSLTGSRNPSADEAEGSYDEFDETINMVQGIRTRDNKRKNSAKKSDGSSTPERGLEAGERPKSAGRKERQRAKEEERARKEREKEEKKKEKMNAKKEKQKKKEDEKRMRQEARERSREATPPRRPATPKKSPSVPTRAAPLPPKSAKSTAAGLKNRATLHNSLQTVLRCVGFPLSFVERGSTSQEASVFSVWGKGFWGVTIRETLLVSPTEETRAPSISPCLFPAQQTEGTTEAGVFLHSPGEGGEPGISETASWREATLRSSPTQPTRSTALSKQTSRETGREAKQTPASLLRSKPPLGTTAADRGAIQRRNQYFGNSDSEEEESVISAPKWKSNKPVQKPKPSVEKEVESDIADLDAVLAELEGIQTGDLLSWLEPNKVTDIDKAEESGESEDSLPLVVPTAPKRPNNKRPSPPRSRAFGFSPQTKPVVTGAGEDTDTPPPSSATTESNFPSQPQLEEGQNSFPNQRDSEVPLADVSSLQRTKHGSPHPGRRRGRANEGGYYYL